MKNKRKNYLIIPVSEVKNRYNLDDNLTKVFDNNYVTKRHQKIVIKLSFDDIYKPSDAYELVTHEKYFFKESLIKTILSFDKDKKLTMLSNDTFINIHPKFVSIKEVKEFYNEIILADEARDYEKSVKKILLNSKKQLFSKRKVKTM